MHLQIARLNICCPPLNFLGVTAQIGVDNCRGNVDPGRREILRGATLRCLYCTVLSLVSVGIVLLLRLILRQLTARPVVVVPLSPRKFHPAVRSHFGGGGGFMPILIRAYRIPLAEVIAPLMQSAFGSISSNLGTAALAARPRFPRAVATQYRTESSGESSRDVISVTSDSMTSLLLIVCVRLARRSAASVLASTVFSELTFAMLSLICFISPGPPLA